MSKLGVPPAEPKEVPSQAPAATATPQTLRDAILMRPSQYLPFEAFGQKCSIRALSGAEVEEAQNWKDGERSNYFILLCLGDEQGNRIFGNDDLPALRNLDHRDLMRVLNAGLEFNEIGTEKKTS